MFVPTTTAANYSPPSRGFPFPQVSKSLKPTHENWDWQLDAACRGLQPEMFFHPEGERGRKRSSREYEAKAICAICPVIAACRSHALSVPEIFGIWGGLGEEDRGNLLRKRLALVV